MDTVQDYSLKHVLQALDKQAWELWTFLLDLRLYRGSHEERCSSIGLYLGEIEPICMNVEWWKRLPGGVQV